MTRGLLICLILLATSMALMGQTAGSLSGTVVGNDGATLAGVVTVHKTLPPIASGRAEAGKDGKFTISNLPAGTYTVCAAVTGRGYLDPCSWSPVHMTVQINAGQAVTGFQLIVNKGEVVQVRLNDPSSLLGATPPPNKTAPHVVLGILTPRGLFEPLAQTGKDPQGRNYQGIVPPDKPSSLQVVPNGLQITDSSGKTLDPKGTTITVQQAKGSPPTLITLTVKP